MNSACYEFIKSDNSWNMFNQVFTQYMVCNFFRPTFHSVFLFTNQYIPGKRKQFKNIGKKTFIRGQEISPDEA